MFWLCWMLEWLKIALVTCFDLILLSNFPFYIHNTICGRADKTSVKSSQVISSKDQKSPTCRHMKWKYYLTWNVYNCLSFHPLSTYSIWKWLKFNILPENEQINFCNLHFYTDFVPCPRCLLFSASQTPRNKVESFEMLVNIWTQIWYIKVKLWQYYYSSNIINSSTKDSLASN